MKRLLCLLLVVAVPALADPPRTFPAGDGCNTCTEIEGMGGSHALSCTAMACLGPTHLVLAQAAPAAADAPVALDEPGTSVHLGTGQGAPFPGRLVSDPEHVRREAINTRNATFYTDVVQGAVVVVAKATLYSLIAGGSGVTVALIGLIVGLFATHKL